MKQDIFPSLTKGLSKPETLSAITKAYSPELAKLSDPGADAVCQAMDEVIKRIESSFQTLVSGWKRRLSHYQGLNRKQLQIHSSIRQPAI